MPKTFELILSDRTGKLLDIFPLFESSTIQHSHEIVSARRTDSGLREKSFWTADFPMYRVENGEAVLYFAPREHNLIFRDIQNTNSLKFTKGDYVPTKKGIEEVVASADTSVVLKIKLSDLRLSGNDYEWKYFQIRTSNPDSLNHAERVFAERVYGQENEFVDNMKMLQEFGIYKTRIYILNPDYVKSRVSGDSAIARISELERSDSEFESSDPKFDAGARNFNYSKGSLRGVLKAVAPQNAEVDQFAEAYNRLLANPQEAYKRMTPEIAVGLSSLLNTYLSNHPKA